MNQDVLIIIGYVISFTALVLCGISLYKEIFKHSTFILFAIAIVTLALSTYLNSDFVDIAKIGDQGKLGEFGDFIGGILNPIFGFFTVILLLTSLKEQRKANDIIHDAEQTKHMTERLDKYINSEGKKLEEMLDAKNIVLYESTLEDPNGTYSITELKSKYSGTPENPDAPPPLLQLLEYRNASNENRELELSPFPNFNRQFQNKEIGALARKEFITMFYSKFEEKYITAKNYIEATLELIRHEKSSIIIKAHKAELNHRIGQLNYFYILTDKNEQRYKDMLNILVIQRLEIISVQRQDQV